MNKTIKLLKLRTRANELEKKFNQSPRIFNRSEWDALIEGYKKIGAESNVTHWTRKLANAESLIQMEHVPMTALGDDNIPWQLDLMPKREEPKADRARSPQPQARDAPEELMYWPGRKDIHD